MKTKKPILAVWVPVLALLTGLTFNNLAGATATDSLLGRWTVSVDLLGDQPTAWLDIRNASGKLVASLSDESGTVEIDDISVSENELRFQYDVNLGDTVQPVRFRLDASQIGFAGTLTTGTESLALTWPVRVVRANQETPGQPLVTDSAEMNESAKSGSLTVAEAGDFLGAWEMTLKKESDQDSAVFKLGILVMDVEGRIVVGHSRWGMKGPQETVSNVSRTPTGMTWTYDGGFFGEPVDVEMSKNHDRLAIKLSIEGQDLGIRGSGVRRQRGAEVGVDPELLTQKPGMKKIRQIAAARIVQIDEQRVYFQQEQTVSVLIANQPLMLPFKRFEISESESVVFMSTPIACVLTAGSRVKMVDVSRPGAVRELGSCSFPGNSANAVNSDGQLVVVANWNGRADSQQLHWIDIADPRRPTLRCSFSTPKGAANYQIDIQGSKLFLATSFGLRVIDAASPDAPVEISLTAGHGQWVRGVDISGTKAYLATSMHAGASWLQIVDVTDPSEPSSVALFQTTGGAQDVAVAGSIAYVADRSAGLVAIDISDPEAPRRVGFFGVVGRADKVSVAGDRVFLNVSGRETSNLLILKSEL